MENNKIISIGINHIHPHPENPRKDLGNLTELAESIKKNGIMQNLTIIPIDGQPGEYYALIGNRRHGASKLAMIETLPCKIVEGMSKKEQLATMLEENMQRNDLTIIEQAQGFQLMLDLGETEDTIAEKTGFSKSTIRHRLNIAKLDQTELKKKEQDDSFQLTLKDLYELEKVQNIKVRNKILKESNNSRDLIWKAQSAVAEEQREKKTEQIVEMLKKLGVEKAPKGAENEIYSNKWSLVKEVGLDKDIPKQIKLPKDINQIFYLPYYRTIRIITKTKNEKKELTPEEVKMKQKDKNKKEIKSKFKHLEARKKDFIENIITGKIDSLKETTELYESIWNVLVCMGTYVSDSNTRKFFTCKNDYECTAEEKEEANKKVKECSFINKMLIEMNHKMDNIGDIFDWQGKFYESRGKVLMDAFDILKKYGWSFEEDDEYLLNGKHELYEKGE